jgi:hypothetical protein
MKPFLSKSLRRTILTVGNPFLLTVPTANAFGSLISVFFALLNHSSKSFIGLL